jgi:dolichyl-phosphate-mannose--protein O-mannosyl transferase
VVYFFEQSGSELREILALGSPLVWWSSLAGLGAAAVRWIRRRGDAELVILVGFGATYLPWLLFDRVRTFVFLYYLVPVIPFLCLAVAAAAVHAVRRRWGAVAAAAYLAAALALFVFFYPVLTARPLTYDAWLARVGWFRDCGDPDVTGGRMTDGARVLPAPRPGPPPPGWCWI